MRRRNATKPSQKRAYFSTQVNARLRVELGAQLARLGQRGLVLGMVLAVALAQVGPLRDLFHRGVAAPLGKYNRREVYILTDLQKTFFQGGVKATMLLKIKGVKTTQE